MSKVETGIRALSVDELELVSGGDAKNPFAGVKAGVEGYVTVEGDDKQPGIGMVVIIGLCLLFGM